MNGMRPPALADWLWIRCGFSARNEALTGDLQEEFQHRQSRAWYWRQVLYAIAVEIVKDWRAHWVLVLRALATGGLAGFLFSNLWAELPFQRALVRAASPLFGLQGATLTAAGITMFFVCGVAAWMVARCHAAQRTSMVMAYWMAIAILFTCDTLSRLSDVLRNGTLGLYCLFGFIMLAGALVGGFLQPERTSAGTALPRL